MKVCHGLFVVQSTTGTKYEVPCSKCKVCRVQCAYNVRRTKYDVQCNIYNVRRVQYTTYNVRSTIVHRTLGVRYPEGRLYNPGVGWDLARKIESPQPSLCTVVNLYRGVYPHRPFCISRISFIAK